MHYIKYSIYILKNKWWVFYAGVCFTKAPLWRLLVHDLSKFSLSEFIPYANFFYRKDLLEGHRHPESTWPASKFKSYWKVQFDLAWNHHQKRNPHHWQYWILRQDSGGSLLLEIPENYVREMVADWMGAGRAITGEWEVWGWYIENRDKMLLHPKTRELVENILKVTETKFRLPI
jgi:hypothetical protein